MPDTGQRPQHIEHGLPNPERCVQDIGRNLPSPGQGVPDTGQRPQHIEHGLPNPGRCVQDIGHDMPDIEAIPPDTRQVLPDIAAW